MRSMVRTAIGVGLVLAAALSSVGSASAACICFTALCPGGVGTTGHAFVQLYAGTLPHPQLKDQKLYYGLYAATGNVVDGAGRINNDSGSDWDYSGCFCEVNGFGEAEYNSAVGRIAADIAAPPDYKLASNNCVDWTHTVAGAAGLVIPDPTGPPVVRNPFKMCADLAYYWDLGTNPPNGGFITKNPEAFSALGLEGSPVDHDYSLVQALGHAAPVSLAAEMALPLFDNLPELEITVGTLELLTITVSASPSEAVISVDWGDASDFEMQTTSYEHEYGVEGVFPASVLVVDHGAVHSYPIAVTVVDLAPPDSLVINPPATAPNTVPNTDFADPIIPLPYGAEIPLLSPLGLFGMVLLVVGTATRLLRGRRPSYR